jgi:hypothetical protein
MASSLACLASLGFFESDDDDFDVSPFVTTMSHVSHPSRTIYPGMGMHVLTRELMVYNLPEYP